MNERMPYGPFSTVFMFFFDLFLSVEVVSILFFNSDAWQIVPKGASHTETILFAIGLAIWAEIVGIRWNVFGQFTKD